MKSKFSINAGTYTLRIKNREEDSVILNNSTQYIIPIFQRPYSWTEHQIRKFITDIFVSFRGNYKNSTPEPMFIGTMQLSKKDGNGRQDIIDGQQRITTFLVLLKILYLRFPESKNLEQISFDWLKTKVNNGKQQEYLDELLNSIALENIENGELNTYTKNALLINMILSEQIEGSANDSSDFNVSAFLNHLFSKIYFVVIETEASLSKTLKIFDAINTTGLDLNTGDIFKIRMYEYLNKDGTNDEVFNEISLLYEKIDTNNKLFNQQVTDIRGILHIYQFYLIAKYGLPTTLYTYGVELFYDRLFETLFNINKWPNFKNNVENGKLVLSIEEINELIDVRYEWEDKWKRGDYEKAENASMVYLWWWSRYSRFWILIFLFLHKFKIESDRYEKLYSFTNQLVKLYLLYSIYYQKSVNEIKNRFNNELIREIVTGSYESVMKLIQDKMDSQTEERISYFERLISGNILYSNKVKNILCRLSALLEEEYYTTDTAKIKKIRENLFDTRIDIEHIQSLNDENLEEREEIKKKWGNNLNSIGNLVVLEQHINRSINNKEHKKIEGYSKSKLEIVKSKLVEIYPNWDLESCRIRKEKEVRKIVDYIFKDKDTVANNA